MVQYDSLRKGELFFTGVCRMNTADPVSQLQEICDLQHGHSGDPAIPPCSVDNQNRAAFLFFGFGHILRQEIEHKIRRGILPGIFSGDRQCGRILLPEKFFQNFIPLFGELIL